MEKTVIYLNELELYSEKSNEHVLLMDTETVAKGYGTSTEVIRLHKKRNADEIVEGKHFTSVTICNAGLKRKKTYWTLLGIIRLGMFIKSENAVCFRDWAEGVLEKEIKGSAEKDMMLYMWRNCSTRGLFYVHKLKLLARYGGKCWEFVQEYGLQPYLVYVEDFQGYMLNEDGATRFLKQFEEKHGKLTLN